MATSAACCYAPLPHPLVSDQGIGDFRERSLDRLLVSNQRSLSLGLRELDPGLDPAGSENGLRDLRLQRPDAVTAAEQTRQLRARASQGAAETQPRKIRRSRHADLGIGSDQILLGGMDIRAPLQQGGRKTGGNFRRHRPDR